MKCSIFISTTASCSSLSLLSFESKYRHRCFGVLNIISQFLIEMTLN